MWPEVLTETGVVDAGWITAGDLFSDTSAIDEYLDYAGSFHPGTDRKTCAATMMIDHCYVLSLATVPLLAGFGIVPELHPERYAMQFYLTSQEHDGHTFQIRRAHVRFLSRRFWADSDLAARHSGAFHLLGHEALCDMFRLQVEEHLDPLVAKLADRSGLSRNALWRLAADSIAARFLDVGRRFNCLDRAKEAAIMILKRDGSPLNNRQLHFFALTLRDSDDRELLSWDFRARGGCCRYYTVKPGEFCDTCVLKNPTARDDELMELMRARYAAANASEP